MVTVKDRNWRNDERLSEDEWALMDLIEYMTEGFAGTHLDSLDPLEIDLILAMYRTSGIREAGGIKVYLEKFPEKAKAYEDFRLEMAEIPNRA